MRLRPVEDQVVVVMGASSGIGRETAIEFASRGAKVVVSARGEEGLDSLAEAIRGFGEVTVIPGDVTDPEQMRDVAEKAVERYGRLDTWVHLAAVSLYARFEATRPSEFEQVVRTNLLGQANGALAALPHLRRNGRGAFISVSSIEAVRALPYQSAYAAAKHGVDGMIEALRVELKRERVPVQITEILPSSIDTPLFEHARTRIGVRPKGMPPVYDARLVARAIVWAAEHPTRRLVVGGGGRLLAALEGIVPGVVDGFLTMAGFRGQRTRVPKSSGAADNLSRPIDAGHSVAAGPESRGRRWSLYSTWTLSPWSRPATAALVLGVGLLAARAVSNRRRENSGRQWRLGRARGGYEYVNPYLYEEPEERSGRLEPATGRRTSLRE
ncbi:MAG TPA: SDR family oxidoreductase [Trueperaceae bacterium]